MSNKELVFVAVSCNAFAYEQVHFNWLVLPHILLLFCLSIYLVAGALVFSVLDEGLARLSLEDLLLFEITTISTIGYGNVTPRSEPAKLFVVIFALFGIPFFLLVVGVVGKHLSKAYWRGVSAVTGRQCLGALRSDTVGLPPVVAIVAFSVLVLAAGFLLRHTGQPSVVDNVYFSFISFSTVGFGDIVPEQRAGWSHFVAVVAYLTIGVALLSSLFAHLGAWLKKLHYLGRRFRGAKDVPVWMGARSMRVSKLLEIVAKEFHASPVEVRRVLRDLDGVIQAVVERQAAERAAREREASRSPDGCAPSGPLAPLLQNLENYDML